MQKKQLYFLLLGMLLWSVLGTPKLAASHAHWVLRCAERMEYSGHPNPVLNGLNPEERTLLIPKTRTERKKLGKLENALRRGEWSGPILSFLDQDGEATMRAALRSLLNGKGRSLTEFQFGTLALRYQAYQDYREFSTRSFLNVALTQKGTLTKFGRAFLSQDNHANDRYRDVAPFELGHFSRKGLSNKELDAFQNAVKGAPLSEQFVQIIVVNKKESHLYAPMQAAHLHMGIENASPGLGAFLTIKADGNPEAADQLGLKMNEVALVIPSFSLFQAYLNARSLGQAPQALVTIGTTNELQLQRDIEERDGRVVWVPMPGIKRPLIADEVLSPGIAFSIHDFLHLYEMNTHAPSYRRVLPAVLNGVIDELRFAKQIKEQGSSFRVGQVEFDDWDWGSGIEKFSHHMLDFMLPSVRLGYGSTIGAKLAEDLQLVDSDHLPQNALGILFVQNLARYPERYRRVGLNPQRVAQDMGTPFDSIYTGFKRQLGDTNF